MNPEKANVSAEGQTRCKSSCSWAKSPPFFFTPSASHASMKNVSNHYFPRPRNRQDGRRVASRFSVCPFVHSFVLSPFLVSLFPASRRIDDGRRRHLRWREKAKPSRLIIIIDGRRVRVRDYDKSTMDTRNLLRGWRECDFAPAVVTRISSKRKVVFGRVPIEYDTSDVQGGRWGWSWHSTNQVHHMVIKILGKDIGMAVDLFMVIRICERSTTIFPKIQK